MSRTSKVFDSLYNRRTGSETADESADTDESSDPAESTTFDREGIAAAVDAALAEYVHDERDGDHETVEADDGPVDEPSAAGRSLARFLGGATLLALLGYVASRRRRTQHDSERDDNATDDTDRSEA
jgi:hypothetical protein